MTSGARVRIGAALVGLTALGCAAAGFLGTCPAWLRVLAVLLGGFVVPALLGTSFARRFVAGSGAFALAFFLVLSAHALISESLRLTGASFATYATSLTWALFAFYGLVILFAWMHRRSTAPEGRVAVARTVWLVVAVGLLTAVAAASRGGYSVEEDAFDHVGFVRRMVAFDAMRPDGVLAWPDDAPSALPPDPRKGALHPTIGWVTSLAEADPEQVWSLLPLLWFPTFVLAFIAFSRALLRERATLVLCIALFVLSYGGTAIQWAHAAAYGQNLAAAWYWILAAIVFCAREDDRVAWRRRLVVCGVLALGGALAHVGVALHAAVLGASLVAFAGWLNLGLRRATAAAAVMVISASVGALMRIGLSAYPSNPLHAHVQGVMWVGDRFFVASPFEILRHFGMVFLGGLCLLPILFFLARSRAEARTVLALCIVPVCVGFVPPIATALYAKGSYMTFRALLNAPVYAAAAIVIAATLAGARARGPAMRTAAAAAVTLWALAFVAPALDAVRADLRGARAVPGVPRSVVDALDRLPGRPTVLSDPATSYWLSAHAVEPFVALYEQHANPRDAYALDRLQAVRDVISPFAGAQEALEACRRYRVDYVVIHAHALTPAPGFMTGWDPMLFEAARARLRAMEPSFREIEGGDDFAVFHFIPGLALVSQPSPPPAPVVAAAPTLSPCTVIAPGGVFEVTGLSVEPVRASAGDSLLVTIGYRCDVAAPYGLPILAHVRFDHESLETGASYPGEKYVRRFEDRRQGRTTRTRLDVRPGRGIFEPDLWPTGTPLCERVAFAVPARVAAGRYRVEVRLVEDALLPNFHARDLLFDRDHYSGTACATFEVVPRAGMSP